MVKLNRSIANKRFDSLKNLDLVTQDTCHINKRKVLRPLLNQNRQDNAFTKLKLPLIEVKQNEIEAKKIISIKTKVIYGANAS